MVPVVAALFLDKVGGVGWGGERENRQTQGGEKKTWAKTENPAVDTPV